MQHQHNTMQEDQGTFMGIGGEGIHYHCWLPEGDVKAVLIIVHGLAEHAGRYGYLVNYFISSGYAVYAIDHIGHGRSSGRRAFVESFDQFVETLKTFRDMVARWQTGKPLFMVGHSMGGLIGCQYLIEHPHDFAGAILSAPAMQLPDSISPVTEILGKVLSSILPRVGLKKLDAEGISRNSHIVEEYEKDSLVYHGRVSARLSVEIHRAMEGVLARAESIKTPILILQGGDDRMVAPEGAQLLYDKAGASDKSLKLYDGLYHEIFNEPERETVFKNVEEWLEKRLSTHH